MCGPSESVSYSSGGTAIAEQKSPAQVGERRFRNDRNNFIYILAASGAVSFSEPGEEEQPSVEYRTAAKLLEAVEAGAFTEITPQATTPAAEQDTDESIRVFSDGSNDIIYVVANGRTYYVSAEGLRRGGSLPSNGLSVQQNVEQFGRREFVIPEPVEAVQVENPDSTPARTNRLHAAQEDTGFDLGDIVQNIQSGTFGRVVGFGRINDGLNDPDPVRVLLVDVGNGVVAASPESVNLAK